MNRSAWLTITTLALTLLGCPSTPTPPSTPPASTSTPTPATTTFIEDDADAAFAAAKASGKLVFVDAWAPWCHTCLSMQRDVLATPRFLAESARFVFLAVDTDRPENAAFLARFAVKVWPTFFVVDPTSDAPLAVHPGSMSLDETMAFLEAAVAARAPTATNDPLVRALLAGHAALAKNDAKAAAQHYAIASASASPRRTEAIVSGLRAWSIVAATDGDAAGCIAFAEKNAGLVTTGGAAGDALSYWLSCADALTDPAAKTTQKAAVRARLQALADTPAPGASVDDRADVLQNLANVAEEAGDAAAHRAAHEQRLALLEADAQKQSTPQGQQVHDYARMNSLLALARGDEAVALFTARSAQLPENYEPQARLASTLFKLKRFDEAKAAATRAVSLAYGTRRLRYLSLLADIEDARGDAAAARAVRETLVNDGEALPAVMRDEKLLAKTKAALSSTTSPTSTTPTTTSPTSTKKP
jgi:thiol-disulfide isomerase/thioredoxin